MPRLPKAQKTFRAALTDAGLSQSELGRLLGKDSVTVNRWCCARLDVPQYARAFLAAYARLGPSARAQLARDLGLAEDT